MGKGDDMLQEEFIDLMVEITDSTDPNQIGLSGRIVDESRQTISILPDDKRVRVIPKANTSFKIIDHRVAKDRTINGSMIIFRPEDRVKRLAPRYRKKVARALMKKESTNQ